MAFNINAHVVLSGPKNIKAVTKSIQKQLGSVKVGIRLDAPKNLNRQIASFNKSIGTLQTRVDSLAASAGRANTNLASLATSFNSLNTASSKMAKSQGAVQNSLDKSGKAIHGLRGEVQAFGKDAALAVRRFAAFTVATGAVFGFVRAVQSATKAALDYEREITKIVQVTGAGQAKIEGLNRTIDGLANSLGVNANELAELARIFAQTGQSIDQVQASIRAVARSSLAPTFGSMKDTAEGLIAAMAQFNIAANQQEAVLASLNAVSKKFAVESEDLISVIRRAGGVFAASRAGFEEPIEGLQQLIGIFTAVRSTTRESADTIAVGLRTIFTRIQRRGTIDFLKQFNIELVDAQGNFIGLFPAFQALSKGLDDIIRRGDALTLSKITEELGGVRQVGKLIPAITQFNKALAATQIAGEAAQQGLGKDVALALQPLGKQFELLQTRFQTLIRTISESQTFQSLAKIALSLGNAFISMAEALQPLIPLLTTFATIKLSRGIIDFSTGFIGGLKKGGGAGGAGGALGSVITGGGGGSGGKSNQGLISSNQKLTVAIDKVANQMSPINTSIGNLQSRVGEVNVSIKSLIGALGRLQLGGGVRGGFGGGRGGRRPRKFARGGPVHGPSHAQGGVPAILEGGEYVIPKGYASGGIASKYGAIALSPMDDVENSKGKVIVGKGGKGEQSLAQYLARRSPSLFNAAKNRSDTRVTMSDYLGTIKRALGGSSLSTSVIGKTFGSAALDREIGDDVDNAISNLIRGTADKLGVVAGAKRTGSVSRALLDSVGTRSTIGSIFEGGLSLLGAPYDRNPSKEQDAFDFPFGLGSSLGAKFQGLGDIPTEAKKDLTTSLMQDIASRKATNFIGEQIFSGALFQGLLGKLNRPKTKVQRRAAGGSIFSRRGTDTVPAMLTPGEFVINKSSAQKVGYGNLNRINRYAQGGIVAPQYLARGGAADAMGGGAALGMVAIPALMSGDMNAALVSLIMVLGSTQTSLSQFRSGTEAALSPLSKSAESYKRINAPIVNAGKSFAGLRTRAVQLRRAFKGLRKSVGKENMMMATALIGPMISQLTDGIVESLRGATITVGGMSGFEGSVGGQMGAAALQAGTQGITPGLMAAQIGGKFGKALTGAVAAFTAVDMIGKAIAARQQAIAFNEFVAFNTTIKNTTKVLQELNKQGQYNADTLKTANDELSSIPKNASDFMEGFSGSLRSKDFWGDVFGGATIGAGIGTAIGTYVGGAIGGMAGTAIPIPGAGTAGGIAAGSFLGAGIGGVAGTLIGGGLGAAKSMFTRRSSIEGGNQKAFEAMVSNFDDAFVKNLDEMSERSAETLSKGLSKALLQQLSTIKLEPAGEDGSINKQVESIGSGFKTLTNVMNKADAPTRDMIDQMQETMKTSIFVAMSKGMDDAGNLIGDTAKKRKFKSESALAMAQLQPEIDKAVESGNITGLIAAIDNLDGVSDSTKEQLKKQFLAASSAELATVNLNATMEQSARIARLAQSAIDALTAGLERFGERTEGIGSSAELAASRAERAFKELTGRRTVGRVDRKSVFADLPNATDQDIDAGISRLQGMGPQREGKVAFQGLRAATRVRRDFPLRAKETVDKLRATAGEGKTISNNDFRRALAESLGTDFDKLPKEMQKVIDSELGGGAGRQDDKVFTIDEFQEKLTKTGGIMEMLGPVSDAMIQSFLKADNALIELQNSVLRVAELEQQMMERRMDTQLRIMDKEMDIRNRLNTALGRTPKALDMAFGDLEKRNRTLVGGGTKFGGISMFGKDVTDPVALANNIRNKEGQRDKLLKQLGIGQDEDPNQAIDRLKQQGKLTEEMERGAHELATLNSQINGSNQALKELADNTTILAAAERDLAVVKAKEKAASTTGVSIVKGLTDLSSGRITEQQFGEQIVAPLQNVEDAFSGQIGTEGAIDLLGRIQGGDALTGGLINRKIAEIAANTGQDEGTVRQEFIRNLTDGIIQSGIGAAGGMGKTGIKTILEQMLGDAGDMRSEAEKITEVMQEFGAKQIEAIKQQQALEEEGFKKIMAAAAKDLSKVVVMFREAVIEFSKFREEPQLPAGVRASGASAGTASGTNTFVAGVGLGSGTPNLDQVVTTPASDTTGGDMPSQELRMTRVPPEEPTLIGKMMNWAKSTVGSATNFLTPKKKKTDKTLNEVRASRLLGEGGLIEEQEQKVEGLKAKRKELGDPTSVHGRKKAKILDKKIEREEERLRRREEAANSTATQKQMEEERKRREKLKEQQRTEQEFSQMEQREQSRASGITPRDTGVGTIPQPPAPARGAIPTQQPLTPADLTKVFTDGANSVANVITSAFEALPTTIQLKAELGTITVNIAGGQFLEGFREGIVNQLRNEIKEGTIRGMTGITGDSTGNELSPDAPTSQGSSSVKKKPFRNKQSFSLGVLGGQL